MSELSVVTLGHVHTEAIESLTAHLTRLEQVVTNLAPRVRLGESRAELNRAVDAAANDWILILREREFLDPALAKEIVSAIAGSSAWGFRISVIPIYASKPLRLGGTAGELRLFHRRHLLRRGELAVEGTVVRLANPVHALTFESAAELAVPHSTLRQLLLFARNARTLDGNTLRYLWIEAGFDQ